MKGEIVKTVRRDMMPLVEKGAMRPHVHATFALSEAAEAHRLVEKGAHFGKVVLTL
ncbi:zinc-binding dehydrogenase [Breoghania sp. L-A4]|uniref:zinc-binding dehydrogenase n=1 Tax=Breoghania sp. L-A4 TaxID=2304600 RepID=UPI003204B414